jgi:protein-disulfide isomerase
VNAQSRLAAPSRVPAGATANGDGVVLGDGPVTVDAYIDFMCPFCRQFEQLAGPTLDAMVAAGEIGLVYHPMAFLDPLSTNRYSTRASASSGCAADHGRFREYAKALFANQPPEGGPGLSDEELIQVGASVGLTDPGFAGCVRNHVYLDWTMYVTERAAERGVSGTPSVYVQGIPVPANARTIVAAVAAVAG